MGFDQLAVRAEQATRQAESAYQTLTSRYIGDQYLEFERTNQVSRRRFSTLVDRIRSSGAPFGAHTIVYQPTGELLLVRHDGVDLWVVPGGGIDSDESYVQTARRELHEEAGIDVEYDGLALLTKIRLRTAGYESWGVLPVFAARAMSIEPEITDPDNEISAARWFETLPADTRDREDILAWRREML